MISYDLYAEITTETFLFAALYGQVTFTPISHNERTLFMQD